MVHNHDKDVGARKAGSRLRGVEPDDQSEAFGSAVFLI